MSTHLHIPGDPTCEHGEPPCCCRLGACGCTCPTTCDCQDESRGLVSNECPFHNARPRVSPDCSLHGDPSRALQPERDF